MSLVLLEIFPLWIYQRGVRPSPLGVDDRFGASSVVWVGLRLGIRRSQQRRMLIELAMSRLDFVPSIAPCRKRSTAWSQTGSPICDLPLQKMEMPILSLEGVPVEKIYRVGNVMIDSLVQLLPAIMQFSRNGLPQRFALVTLHRPSNVDDTTNLNNILKSLK